jgi:hypothetical protein
VPFGLAAEKPVRESPPRRDGDRRQLHASGDVADRVNALDVRVLPQVGRNLAVLADGDPRLAESQPSVFGMRPTAQITASKGPSAAPAARRMRRPSAALSIAVGSA